MIKAFIGLGNSGPEYSKTYHNVGLFVAKELSQYASGADPDREMAVYPIKGFMNESGGPVRAWILQHNFKIEEVLVIHDDSDLPVGDYKLVFGGGSAGHKGTQSLISNLGTENFWRLRVGIRDPKEEVRKKAGDFVLDKWSGHEEKEFQSIAARAWPAISVL